MFGYGAGLATLLPLLERVDYCEKHGQLTLNVEGLDAGGVKFISGEIHLSSDGHGR